MASSPTMISITCPFCGLVCDDFGAEGGIVDTSGCAKGAAGFARATGVAPHEVDGVPATLAEAAAAAADLLRQARLPVIAGLSADLAGIRALIALADRVGAIIDHGRSAVVLRNLAVIQATGGVTASFSEVANRADT